VTTSLSPQFLAAVLSVLKSHVGRANAIGRSRLCAALAVMGFGEPSKGVLRVDERKVREAVSALRKSGELIGSTGGIGGGYWVLADMREVRAFFDGELRPRAMDLLETEKAMRIAAERRWPMEQLGIGL
jgi:hypothetical protein